MDNPIRDKGNKHKFFSLRKKAYIHPNDGSTLSNTDIASDVSSVNSLNAIMPESPMKIFNERHSTSEQSSSKNYSSINEQKNQRPKHHFSSFSRHISMTAFDKISNAMNSSNKTEDLFSKPGGLYNSVTKSKSQVSLNSLSSNQSNIGKSSIPPGDSVKMAHKRDSERWSSLKQLNSSKEFSDPLTYSSARLELLLDLYDSVLRDEETGSISSKFHLLEFWSISALKAISGVDVHFTTEVIRNFENYNLKNKQKTKVLKLHDEYYGIQWAWQLAIDNPTANIFDFSTTPILSTMALSEHKKIGPSNFHIIHGKSYTELPFSKNSFSFVLGYSLFYYLKSDEWDLTLKELYRVTQPNGSAHLFLMDLEFLNCTNKALNNYFEKIRAFFKSKGIDCNPCKKAQARLRNAGFQNVRYSLVSLKSGVPSIMGNLMDFIVLYFDFIVYDKFAKLQLDQKTLYEFKEMRLAFNDGLRNGELLEGFGDLYLMFIFGDKKVY